MLVLLAGCSFGSVTSEEAIEESKEAMEDIESVEIKYKEKETDYTDSGIFQIDFKNDISRYDFEELEIAIYKEDDKVLIEEPSGDVAEMEEATFNQDFAHRVDFLVDPFDTLEDFDEDFIDHFEVEKNKDKDELILTYVGDEEDEEISNDFGKGYIGFSLYGTEFNDHMDLIEEAIEINEVSFEMILDDSNYTIKQMKWNMKYEENDEKMNLKHQYSLSKYDDIKDIEALEKTTTSTSSPGNSDDVDPNEAASYLDALIQATIFQDADGFVDASPESMSKEDSEEEGKVQRDFFREIYIENTKGNMDGTGVTDEQVEALADAFINALGETAYEIVDAEETGDGAVLVTVSVQGLDDTKIYADTDDILYELIESGEVTEDNFIDKNMDILTGMYEDADILDAVEVQVNVFKEGDNYLVPSQDEYLIGGFVQ